MFATRSAATKVETRIASLPATFLKRSRITCLFSNRCPSSVFDPSQKHKPLSASGNPKKADYSHFFLTCAAIAVAVPISKFVNWQKEG